MFFRKKEHIFYICFLSAILTTYTLYARILSPYRLLTNLPMCQTVK